MVSVDREHDTSIQSWGVGTMGAGTDLLCLSTLRHCKVKQQREEESYNLSRSAYGRMNLNICFVKPLP